MPNGRNRLSRNVLSDAFASAALLKISVKRPVTNEEH